MSDDGLDDFRVPVCYGCKVDLVKGTKLDMWKCPKCKIKHGFCRHCRIYEPGLGQKCFWCKLYYCTPEWQSEGEFFGKLYCCAKCFSKRPRK